MTHDLLTLNTPLDNSHVLIARLAIQLTRERKYDPAVIVAEHAAALAMYAVQWSSECESTRDAALKAMRVIAGYYGAHVVVVGQSGGDYVALRFSGSKFSSATGNLMILARRNRAAADKAAGLTASAR
jgi:hypothetical protein